MDFTGLLFSKSQDRNFHLIWKKVFNAGLVLLFLSALFNFSFQSVMYHWNWAAIYPYRYKLLTGWVVTLVLSLASLLLSILIGLFFAMGRRSSFLPLQYFSRIYVEGIRATPLLVQILIFFYVVAHAFHVNNRYGVGILTLSLFSGAYVSEIIRSGIESVGRSQLESARAIGLTRVQTYRYVIFPQAFRHILPPLTGQLVSLIKDSSLLSVISIGEFTLSAQEINSYTYSTLEGYLPLAVGYWILTLPVSAIAKTLERKYRFET